MDAQEKYWRESLDCALEDVGAFDLLTNDMKDRIASSLSGSAENQGMAFGYEAIPDPAIALVRQHKQELAEEEKRSNRFREAIARRHGVDPRRIIINSMNEIEISST